MSDTWSSTWQDEAPKEPKPPDEKEQDLIKEAKKRFKACVDWEAQARIWFEYDYKFANGDTHNKYQWDADILNSREIDDRPCLTINKTKIHNLMVINDAKQNKPGVRIRPVGEQASFDGAQVYQELIYHIEYISNAENVYDSATTFQVEGGIGYWRIDTDYISDDSFDQEIYIRRIKDPRCVYLDPNINEVDGSDAVFGFIFDDMDKDLFRIKYPEFAFIAGSQVLGNTLSNDGWVTRNNVRVAEYFRKTQNKDKLVAFIDPETQEQIITHYSKLSAEGKELANQLKKVKDPGYRERKVIRDDIEWYKIAGDRIVEQGSWAGKYIPIVRLVGSETIIDGILDRKGHTRALINAQQIYNYNSSANVEFGALQTKSPWIAPSEAVENYEEYWKTANTDNHSYLPYNHMGEDGQPIPPPSRPASPQASPAYVQGLQIAQNEMMMATGQYQSQMGENENAKSGIAINARQRQGDKATYHFIDNQAIAIRFTGKILIDLVPKIYDTKRVMQISATDGSILNLTIDPEAQQEIDKKMPKEGEPQKYKGQQIIEMIFNPTFGQYDIMADTGPSFATRRQEAFNALTQIAAQNKDFLNIAGDILWEVADFPKADILSQRYRRIIPPNVLGEGPDKETSELMEKASSQIEGLNKQLQELSQKLADRSEEFDIKRGELDIRLKEVSATQQRLDYEAENKRLVALGNSGPAVSVEQIQPIVQQLLEGMMNAGEPSSGNIPIKSAQDIAREKQLMEPPQSPANGNGASAPEPQDEEPPVEGAQKAPDNNWYVQNPEGGYSRVDVGE